ncbi:MAG: hypothetical protein ACKPKO_46610, partial [Candidatus Fonsibacter sp.]
RGGERQVDTTTVAFSLRRVPAVFGILLGEEHAPQTYETAVEVEAIMCADVNDNERCAVQEELRMCRSMQDCASVAARHVKRSGG